MKIRLFIIALLGGLLLGSGVVSAQNIPAPMSPARLVNDYAGILNPSQRATLEDSLVAYDRATSTQITVVTVNDLDGASSAEYATKLLTQWGVGHKGKDNGVVLLLKPRNSHGGGEVFIATGYGAEGALPDILCGQIIDRSMMPALRSGDYAVALDRGAAAIRDALKGEYSAEALPQDVDWAGAIFGLFVMIFIVMAVMKAYRGGANDDEDSDGDSGPGGRNFRRGPMMFPPIIGGMGGRGGGFGGGGFGGFGGGMGGGGGGGRSF